MNNKNLILLALIGLGFYLYRKQQKTIVINSFENPILVKIPPGIVKQSITALTEKDLEFDPMETNPMYMNPDQLSPEILAKLVSTKDLIL